MDASTLPPKSYYRYDEDQALLDAEFDHIRKRKGREDRGRDDLAGLALSGGGIRSAVFSLGVMQALAHSDFMKRFDYLSTASGGGYIGSALTWFLSKDPGLFGSERNRFPFGADRRNPAKEAGDRGKRIGVVRYIRQARYFLFPGSGIGPFSILGVVLRGALVNLAVYLTLMVGFMAAWKRLQGSRSAEVLTGAVPWTDDLGFSLALLMLGIFLVIATAYALATPLLIHFRTGWTYSLRRGTEIATTWIGLIAVVGVVMGVVPLLDHYFSGLKIRLHTPGGLTLSGLVLSVWTFARRSSPTILKLPVSLVGGLASGLLLFGLLLAAHATTDMKAASPAWIAAACLLAIVVGLWAKVNLLTVHRYYRDRLMETFLPNLGSVYANRREPATEANHFGINEACRYDKAPDVDAPYHLVNTNVLLNDSTITKYRSRGGDNFILSPLFCGSRATGWISSERFLKGDMTLATAMAISGAAVSPGAGPIRNPMVTALMSLLNLQLGYWVPNPMRMPRMKPNVLIPGSWQTLRVVMKRIDETSSFVELTDGGFFDNMAIYELIRRKARLIVLVDGVADPDYAFADFGNALEKIRVDFGAKIDIDLAPLMPQDATPRLKDRKLSQEGHAVGTITYGDDTQGLLLYIKTVLVDGLPEDVYAYAEANPTFPDQSTADQFFDEKQFEAYRELGYQLADRALTNLKEASGAAEDEVTKAEVFRALGSAAEAGTS